MQRGEFGQQRRICCWTQKIHALLKRVRILSSQRMQAVLTVKLKLLMLFCREKVAFYYNDRTKNTLNGQNAGFWNVKARGLCTTNYFALKDDTTEVYCGQR